MTLRVPLPFAVLLLVTACQSSSSPYKAKGAVEPTVAGRTPAVFCSLEEGRAAFTRCGDSLTAALEDASWLRFEGDPACVEAEHRAYFEYGYTTFQIELRSKNFTQPTKECFVLEDSAGRRVSGSPLTYEGAPCLVDDRWFSTFQISFRHILSRELTWIRLTRLADGDLLEWTFGPCPAPCPEPCPAPCPPPCGTFPVGGV